MPRFLSNTLLAAIVGAWVTPAVADLTVDLNSSTDLTKLTVGQEVTITVNLMGLPANDFIFVLDTHVLFPTAEFAPVADPANSSGLTPGTVFLTDSTYGPLQRSNFNAASSLSSTGATGNFSDSSPSTAAAIGQDGVYYSFTLMASAAGSGSIQFDPISGANRYAANDTGFNFAPLPTGGALAFDVSPAVAVPEPSTMTMIATGLGFLACSRWWGHRIAAGPIRR